MKRAQLCVYGVGFLFIAVCAALTAYMQADASGPTPAGSQARSTTDRLRFDPEHYFDLRDADGDGQLSLDEYQASMWGRREASYDAFMAKSFKVTDGDADGYVTRDESRAFWSQMRGLWQRTARWFDASDMDRDGRVSLEEALAGVTDEERRIDLADVHGLFDLDADGQMDRREMGRGVYVALIETGRVPFDDAADREGPHGGQ